MKTPSTFTMRDPLELRGHIHPALKLIPELDEHSPEFLAIAAGVGQVGLIQPLLVDDQGRVMDDHSRTLLRCAIRWQLKTVPVHIGNADDIHLVIIHSLAHRRHLSKSAIAYLAVPHLEPAFENARLRKLKQIKDNSVVSSGDYFQTVEEMGDALGLGRNLLFEARKVQAAFTDKKIYTFNVRGGAADGEIRECTLKAWYEPKLLQPFIGGEHENNRPLGLGGILAGIASVKEGNRGKFDSRSKDQLELFNKVLTSGLTRWKYWSKFTEQDRAAHFATVREQIASLESDECEALAEYHAKLAAEFRKGAKATTEK